MLALLTYLFDLVEIEARELNVVFALRWNTAGISLGDVESMMWSRIVENSALSKIMVIVFSILGLVL